MPHPDAREPSGKGLLLQRPRSGLSGDSGRTLEELIIPGTALVAYLQTHKRTALHVIYLQNRRSTTELRPQALLHIDNRRHAQLSGIERDKWAHSARRADNCKGYKGHAHSERGNRTALTQRLFSAGSVRPWDSLISSGLHRSPRQRTAEPGAIRTRPGTGGSSRP